MITASDLRKIYLSASDHEGNATFEERQARWLAFKMQQSARLEAAFWTLVDWPEKRSVVERKLERLRRL